MFDQTEPYVFMWALRHAMCVNNSACAKYDIFPQSTLVDVKIIMSTQTRCMVMTHRDLHINTHPRRCTARHTGLMIMWEDRKTHLHFVCA